MYNITLYMMQPLFLKFYSLVIDTILSDGGKNDYRSCRAIFINDN